MDVATGGPLVCILNEEDAKRLDVHSGDRILVKFKKRETTCIVNVSESDKAVAKGTIGLFEEVLDTLHVQNKDTVEICFTGKPESLKHIRDKLYGKELTYKEMYHIIDDITHDRLSEVEKTYFVSAGFANGFTTNEIVNMTKAMVETGDKLKFKGVTLDKHCIGGVPGNRTTMIVVPILAAAGFTIPKTSSRAITSPAGTADTMECLAKVTLSEKKIKEVVRKTKACIVHGGSMNLAPADDKIIEVEHPLSIDAEGQLLASVMAKKHSVSANHVLIDIPVGKGAKVESKRDAAHLKWMFTKIGKKLGMNVKVILTDGSQPVGNGVGPLLELRDVISILQNDPLAPLDLKQKALSMVATLLHMAGKYSKRSALVHAREILESGKALRKMHQIMSAQGKVTQPKLGTQTHIVRSGKSGIVKRIDNKIVAKIATTSGAPEDKGAGMYLHKKVGDTVKKGEVLYTVYAYSKFKLQLAKTFIQDGTGYEIR